MSFRDESGVVVKGRTLMLEPPSMYAVLLVNDDYTPMEFVVMLIQEHFGKDRETAVQIMLKVHRDGKCVCGRYSKDVALMKVERVLRTASQAGHPLQCVMEEI